VLQPFAVEKDRSPTIRRVRPGDEEEEDPEHPDGTLKQPEMPDSKAPAPGAKAEAAPKEEAKEESAKDEEKEKEPTAASGDAAEEPKSTEKAEGQ